jgi:hypothetical protein
MVAESGSGGILQRADINRFGLIAGHGLIPGVHVAGERYSYTTCTRPYSGSSCNTSEVETSNIALKSDHCFILQNASQWLSPRALLAPYMLRNALVRRLFDGLKF